MEDGVSVVICCHNSASRLPTTLEHLVAQEVSGTARWEVLVVDNASTDETGARALECWKDSTAARLRVVNEPTPGLGNARLRGIADARFDIVSFIDDDNWVGRDWVMTILELFSSHPEIGACGGRIEAVTEVKAPIWFEIHQDCFAIGAQATSAGDVTDDRGYLWGAGLTIRKDAFLKLLRKGFVFRLTDRKGASLSSGGDSEICCALRLAGWRLWYEPSLYLRHFVPRERMEWRYLRKLMRGFGASSVGMDSYQYHLQPRSAKIVDRMRKSWLVQLAVAAGKLSIHLARSPIDWMRNGKHNSSTLKREWFEGRIRELWTQKDGYREAIDSVESADWHLNGGAAESNP